MSKKQKLVVLLITALGCLPLGSVINYAYHSFYDYQSQVDSILQHLPEEEANLAPVVQDVLQNTDGPGRMRMLCVWLLFEFNPPDKMSKLAFHAQELIWQTLLPGRLSDKQLMSLYAHFMIFEKGRGLTHGAQYYFAKKPSELTTDEVIQLLAISRSPTGYSTRTDPQAFAKQAEKVRQVYQSNKTRRQ